MADNDDALKETKVRAQEKGLRVIYQEVFSALNRDDIRAKCTPEELETLRSALAPPATIAFDQLVAVLKALKSSTNEDKLQMERVIFLSAPTKDNRTVGQFINDECRKLGLNYGDLREFVHQTGWAKK